MVVRTVLAVYLVGVIFLLVIRTYAPWPDGRASFVFSVLTWPMLVLVILAAELQS
jgi:hypothetical protein